MHQKPRVVFSVLSRGRSRKRVRSSARRRAGRRPCSRRGRSRRFGTCSSATSTWASIHPESTSERTPAGQPVTFVRSPNHHGARVVLDLERLEIVPPGRRLACAGMRRAAISSMRGRCIWPMRLASCRSRPPTMFFMQPSSAQCAEVAAGVGWLLVVLAHRVRQQLRSGSTSTYVLVMWCKLFPGMGAPPSRRRRTVERRASVAVRAPTETEQRLPTVCPERSRPALVDRGE